VTMRYASIRHHDRWVLALTACGAIAGPALLGVAGATPDLPLAIAAIVLTATIVGVAHRHRARLVGVPVPAGHRGPRPPTWVSP
jgi:hypothetical protein